MSTISANTISAGLLTVHTFSTNTITTNTVTSNTVTANVAVPSSGKIGFGSDEVIITHSSNKLDIDGGVVDFGSVPTVNGASVGMTFGTAQATTSGTSKDFSIPTWVKRITVMFDGVSTNGTSRRLIQIGTGGVATTTGYLTVASQAFNSGGSTLNVTTGFAPIASAAADNLNGVMTITNITGNSWVMSYVGGLTNAGNGNISGGTITLANTLNFLRLTTENGTDVFDAGQINIYYE